MEKYFLLLPSFIKSIIVSLVGFRLKLRRNKYSYDFNVLESKGEIDNFHNEKVKEALYSANESEFFSKIFYSKKVDFESDKLLEELKKIPLSNKETVKQSCELIAIDRKNSFSQKTSGTTGSGLSFKATVFSESIMWSFFERFRNKIGISTKDYCGYFCGRTIMSVDEQHPPYWIVNYAGKQILFSNYHLNSQTVDSYISALNKYQPPWIHGYPSFLSLLAKLAIQKKLKLNYVPVAITVGSENYSSNQRKTIERFFKASSFELYCQTEGVAMFSECPHGSIHVEEEFSYVEFLDVGENRYEVVGTSFYNSAFPFVRYRTGDIVELSQDKCSCGSSFRVVKSIDGRQEDYITLKNGTKVGRLDHIFKSLDHIVEAQIRQDISGHVTFYIVKGPKYCYDDEVLLKSEIVSRLSNELKFDICYVPVLERTKTGKLRFVLSDVN